MPTSALRVNVLSHAAMQWRASPHGRARTPEVQRHGEVAFDRRDHMSPGWWHGP
jgi:hypothetical protein